MGSIAARLLSLADLAEDVAGRSFLVRWLVLWYVCRADAILREFVAGSEWNTAGRLWSPSLPPVRYGTRSADAMALAASLRALARIVLDMRAERRRLAIVRQASDEGHDGNPIHDLEAVVQTLWHADFLPVEVCDTS
ncbi:MAG: hypothetical protein KF694_10905 [Mesorhizobium sp.]|nr:hypothetical protein [Mesorhizobium sp.]